MTKSKEQDIKIDCEECNHTIIYPFTKNKEEFDKRFDNPNNKGYIVCPNCGHENKINHQRSERAKYEL